MDKKKKEEEIESDWNSASMIKAISSLLSEILNENKQESKLSLTQTQIRQNLSSLQKNHPLSR
jgi:hypothetical protein